MKRKTNVAIAETIKAAQKQKAWLQFASRLASSTRKYSAINLSEIEKQAKEGDTVIIIGKVLGTGDLTKKVRICALSFTGSARDKLKKSKSELVTISEEIKHNPKAQGLKLIN